ncbi:MAG: NYN domain-containing protein [Anaerolineae bacterium]|nr:NYN domain-containing protein [Anaerolineae bacterium]MDW8171305.1 NYN domain-containing protein [Anaerolineae bacterium]
MPYLIDGHNLIQCSPGLSLDDPDDEMKLVNKLRGFALRVRKRCVVVFDQGIVGGRSAASTEAVEVIFASQGLASADDLILQRLNGLRDAQQWTLVTSDREIMQVGRAVGVRIMQSQQFVQLLEAPDKPQAEPGEWTHVHVPKHEVDELLPLFDPQAPKPSAPPAQKPLRRQSQGKKASSSGKSLPKGARSSPTSAPKKPRRPYTPPPALPDDPTLAAWRARRAEKPNPSLQTSVPPIASALPQVERAAERPLPVWQRPAPPEPPPVEKPIKPPPLNPLKAGGYIGDDDVREWESYVREDLPLPDNASRGQLKPPKPRPLGSIADSAPAPTPPKQDVGRSAKIGRGTITEQDAAEWRAWVEKYGGGQPNPPKPKKKK